MREKPTRYGFPPDRPAFEPFPTEIPWDTPIHEISGWWLNIEADDGSSIRTPLRLMAAEHGWKLTLRQILPRLSREGIPPRQVMLLKHGGVELSHPDRAVGKVLVLLG